MTCPQTMALLCARQARSHAVRMAVTQAATKQPFTKCQSKILRPARKNQAQTTSTLPPNGTHVVYKTLPR